MPRVKPAPTSTPILYEHLSVFLSYSDVPDYVTLQQDRWELVTVYESVPPGIAIDASKFSGRTFVFKRVKV